MVWLHVDIQTLFITSSYLFCICSLSKIRSLESTETIIKGVSFYVVCHSLACRIADSEDQQKTLCTLKIPMVSSNRHLHYQYWS